ncbi:zinc finger protein 443 [Folsomia candida]|uniref:zinc finger protein 443 n=1 Tax=Folsomia candida TaxID=158441 RepID=UPI000B90746A|nr:zinc finger protein 443 [Folsomia candida]
MLTGGIVGSRSLASEGSAWYRCTECQAVFKLKHLIVRHLKTRHLLPDRPEWELDNNDEKCATWWERVKVEGTTITAVERVAKPIIDDTVTPTFSLQEFNAATTSNPATLVLSETAKKFKCDLCTVDMWFAFKKSLYAHLLKNHDRGLCKVPGLNLCRFCGFRAETPSFLKAHVKTHTGEREEDARLVECSAHCGRVFSSKASMKKHVRFKCVEAKRLGLDGSGCVADGQVQTGQHHEEVQIMTSRVPKTNPHVLRQSATDLPFRCPQCVETFPTQNRLSGHMGVHSGDLYRCRYCSAPFAHVHTRGAHETNAHNEELGYGYRCPVCSKNFANIATIRGHYKYTHWLDLPPREEIEGWRIGDASLAQQDVETVVILAEQDDGQHEHQPQHHTITVQIQPDFHSMLQQQQAQQHLQQEQQNHAHNVMSLQQHHVQVQTHPQHQNQNHNQQQHYSLRMPVGFGVSQITMGALIGHIPLGDPSPGPSNNNNNALITAKKTRKPRAPRNPNTTPAKKTVGTSKNAAVMGRGGGKKRKQPLPPAKVERKKFHCRKPGCEGKFQRRWELTWHLERAHGEFTCEFCSSPPFDAKMAMVHHQYQIHHRELGCYECRLCGRGLESPRGVQEHVALEHPGTEIPLTLEAKMWRRGAIHRKRVQRPEPTSTTTMQQ